MINVGANNHSSCISHSFHSIIRKIRDSNFYFINKIESPIWDQTWFEISRVRGGMQNALRIEMNE